MTFEIFFPYPKSEYNEGIMLEEYKNTYCLVSAMSGQNGAFKKWCYPQTKNRFASEKAIPWKINLGNHRESIDMLRKILDELENK